jgi:hypothetical protein
MPAVHPNIINVVEESSMWIIYTACWVVGAVGLYTFLVRTSKEVDPRANIDGGSIEIDAPAKPYMVEEEPEELRKAA